MSSVPPPIPPYNPKDQWRIHREQQKAAWRAQRDAWRAQRRAWKAGFISTYGPRVPSLVGPILLIGVGVVALLLVTNRLNAVVFWAWYGRHWPLLLIGAGLAMLAEWAIDLRRMRPVRRKGNFVGLLVLLGVLGVLAAEWSHMKSWSSQLNANNNWGLNADFPGLLGLPEHDFDAPVQNLSLPANANLDIENPHGNVNIAAGAVSSLQVQAHEVAYAKSDPEAQKIFTNVAARVTQEGRDVRIASAGSANGRVDLTVIVPKSVLATIHAGKGNVTATGLNNGIRVTAHGNVRLDAITGPVEAHMFDGNHDFSAQNVQGDLQITGDVNDITLSQIRGQVVQSGEILGDANIERLRGPLRLHTSVTTIELARLPGDLALDSDDLHINQAYGPVRVATHAKDVDLSQIYGDSSVEDRDGSISVEPAGAYGVQATNSKGSVELTLPPNAAATVDARTHNGDILCDYPIPQLAGADKAVTFRIGSGAARIVLSADNGDVRIKKGPGFPPPGSPDGAWSEPPALAARPASSLADARHLRAPKPLPAHPVSQ